MKIRKYLLLACGMALAATSAWADPPRHHYRPRSSVEFGVYVGAPWAYPSYYPYPPYYYWPRVYVPPVIVTPQPPVYVEQQPAAPASVPTLEAGFWYYCNEAQAYYPYVKQCPGSWQKVAPQVPQ